MVEILAKNNIDEIFEEVNSYVDENTKLPLLRIDDKLISIGVSEDGRVYFTVKGGKESRIVLLGNPAPDYSHIKNAFDALVEDIATKNN